jgi:uncharacterized Tic20 family protein
LQALPRRKSGIMAKHKLNWQIQALVAIITLVIIYPSWIPVCNATADDEGKLTQICQTIAIFTNPYFWPFSSAQLSSVQLQCSVFNLCSAKLATIKKSRGEEQSTRRSYGSSSSQFNNMWSSLFTAAADKMKN